MDVLTKPPRVLYRTACPHDGGHCHHDCLGRESPCFRLETGGQLSTPYAGFPVAGNSPVVFADPALFPSHPHARTPEKTL